MKHGETCNKEDDMKVYQFKLYIHTYNKTYTIWLSFESDSEENARKQLNEFMIETRAFEDDNIDSVIIQKAA